MEASVGPPWMNGGPGNWPKVLQAGRGNIRPIILQALNERPMHGYEIIRHFAIRSNGHWKPSPGSVYPTLKKLTADGLIKAEIIGGREKYHVTRKGKLEIEGLDAADPWQGVKHPELLSMIGPLMREFMPLMHSIAMNGTRADAIAASAILQDATTKLKALHKEQKENKKL